MSSGPQTVQEQRWQAWHERAREIGKSDSGQRYYLWSSFLEKAENARLETIPFTAFIGLIFACLIMIITMLATRTPDPIDPDTIDTKCLGFKIGSGVAALSFVVPTCVACRCVMKHRREIREDKDDYGGELHQRTIDADAGMWDYVRLKESTSAQAQAL